jgi:hypothetical protein
MMFGYLTLFTALILSLSAAVYSILGLTAIFAAAFWPIVVLGGSLEFGKIVTTLWLHKYWDRAEIQYKVYLCSAVIILMVLTSMGVFGFLSKAHLDQAVPSGDIQAQVQIFDDKIQTQKDNIKTARAALTQMDSAVDQTMGRSQDEKGADKAVAIRRSQARERTALQNDISKAQTEITRLQEQRAPVASQARQVEAEVGPIKYIAALIYGDNPEANLLEKAVRWVIILIVIVFDPLALTLLLAATKTFEWERGINILAPGKKKDNDEEVDSWFSRAKERARFWDKKREEQTEDPSTFISPLDNSEPVVDRQHTTAAENEYFATEQSTANDILKQGVTNSNPDDAMPIEQNAQLVPQENKKKNVLSGLDVMWNRATSVFKKDPEAEHAPIDPQIVDTLSVKETTTDDHEDGTTDAEKEAQRAWKTANPGDTIKKHRSLYDAGHITDLPWNTSDYHPDYRGQLGLAADNVPHSGEVKGFGTQFPANPSKGDMFLRVDRLPSALYKFNGNIWIEVDKALSDQHAYDAAYIDHLISKISTGEYDPELLSDAERTSIEQRLSGA